MSLFICNIESCRCVSRTSLTVWIQPVVSTNIWAEGGRNWRDQILPPQIPLQPVQGGALGVWVGRVGMKRESGWWFFWGTSGKASGYPGASDPKVHLSQHPHCQWWVGRLSECPSECWLLTQCGEPYIKLCGPQWSRHHMNQIKGNWMLAECKLKKLGRTSDALFRSYLGKFMWCRRYTDMDIHPFAQLLMCIRQRYWVTASTWFSLICRSYFYELLPSYDFHWHAIFLLSLPG